MNRNVSEMMKSILAGLNSWGIEVQFIHDGEDSIAIGELREGKIKLNTNARDELSQIFTIAHLFGHYCQFKDYDEYKHLIEIVNQPLPVTPDADFKAEFWRYEQEAFGIGLTLMTSAFNVTEKTKRYYQVFMQTDFDHFWNYITTGVNENIRQFNKALKRNYRNVEFTGTPMNALPIPGQVSRSSNHTQVTIF